MRSPYGDLMKLLMIDDHPIVVDGVAAVLPPTFEMVHSSSNAEDGLVWLQSHCVDLVVLDLSMPGMGGQEAVRRIRRRFPKLAIMIFSAHCASPICRWLLDQGVQALVDKNADLDELIQGLNAVRNGQRFLSHSLAQAQVLGQHKGDQLSEREFQVLQMLLKGMRPASIAEHLFISTKTVSTYRQRAMTRLGLTNDVELFQYAVSEGWMESAASL